MGICTQEYNSVEEVVASMWNPEGLANYTGEVGRAGGGVRLGA